MKTIFPWFVTVGSLVLSMFMGYQTWSTQQENYRLQFLTDVSVAEHRILKDEIQELSYRPTYEQGYKDAIVRLGGPQNSGAYQDGWDDAFKIFGDQSGYAEGYHTAIQQFGYTKTPGQNRWLVPEPTEKTKEEEQTDKFPIKNQK